MSDEGAENHGFERGGRSNPRRLLSHPRGYRRPVLLPPVCPLCAAVGAAPCVPCRRLLIGGGSLTPPVGVSRCAAALRYEGAGRVVVTALKYRNRRSVVPWLAASMAALVSDPPDVVTWVPCLPGRRGRRGFDQGEVLARRVAREIGGTGASVVAPTGYGASNGARCGPPAWRTPTDGPPVWGRARGRRRRRHDDRCEPPGGGARAARRGSGADRRGGRCVDAVQGAPLARR